jgi:hypothetical protein
MPLAPSVMRWPRVALLATGLALPMLVDAQVRRPDPSPGARPGQPARRYKGLKSEWLFGLGSQGLARENAVGNATPVVSLGYRHHVGPNWLFLGATVDGGRPLVEGSLPGIGPIFPLERIRVADSSFFTSIDAPATFVSGMVNGDILWAVDDDQRYHAGATVGVGMYGVLPSRGDGPETGSVFGPRVRSGFTGRADLTRRVGVFGTVAATWLLNFKSKRLRTSSVAGEDPVFSFPGAVTLYNPPTTIGSVFLQVGMTLRAASDVTPRGGRR